MDETRIAATVTVPQTLVEVIKHFSDPLTCVNFMAKLRWADGPACPRCASKRLSFLTTRLMWKCLDCKKQFSVKVGTIFEDSAIGLDKWLCAMWLISSCKNGISSYELARDIHVEQRSAWFMLHRIRFVMQTGTFAKLAGTVEADETFVGGKVINMHLDKQTRLRMGKRRTGGVEGKAVIMGLLERHGEARVKVLPNTRAFTSARTSLTTWRRVRPCIAIRCARIAICQWTITFMSLSTTPKPMFGESCIPTVLKISGVSSREHSRERTFRWSHSTCKRMPMSRHFGSTNARPLMQIAS